MLIFVGIKEMNLMPLMDLIYKVRKWSKTSAGKAAVKDLKDKYFRDKNHSLVTNAEERTFIKKNTKLQR